MLLQVKAPAFKKKETKNPNLFGAGGQLLFADGGQGHSDSDSDSDNATIKKKKRSQPTEKKVILVLHCCCF